MGMGLMGVRVTTGTPLEGFTLTREDGEFDLLVNGGGAVVLQFGRSPFKPQSFVTYVPWNEVTATFHLLCVHLLYSRNCDLFRALFLVDNYDRYDYHVIDRRQKPSNSTADM